MAQPLWLTIEGARQNNLKNLSLRIPHDKVTVITGVSGSGKSSLAFDTLFAEGQWRYIESLSTYARMFLERLDRPDVDRISEIRPAIAIEQKNPVRTARSTVGTATETADSLRLLFAKIGRIFCPKCGKEARVDSAESATQELLDLAPGQRALIGFGMSLPPTANVQELFSDLIRRGFARIKIGSELLDLTAAPAAKLDKRSDVIVILDRVILSPNQRGRITESIETALREGKGRCVVEIIDVGTRIYGTDLRCYDCDLALGRPEPPLFSFNHPLGACPECKGFGNLLRYDETLVVPDPSKSLADGAVEPWRHPSARWYQRELLKAAKRQHIDTTQPYADLPENVRRWIYDGDDNFSGIAGFFEDLEGYRYKLHVRVLLSRYRSQSPCPSCQGARLKPEALAVKLHGRSIADVCRLSVEELAAFIRDLPLSSWEARVAKEILKQLHDKLNFLLQVGLGYLTLDRQTRTLSGGEAQRINLANQLGSQLVGTLYILDEPSIGLHARDTARLAELCRELAYQGNTVVIVEHDRTFMDVADYLVELGPGAGQRGGEVVFAGPKEEFLKDSRSLTARYLTGKALIPLPIARRKGNGKSLTLVGARAHNLKNLTVKIPLNTLTVISGVSGSGKSTLVHETLYRAVARAFKVEFETPGEYDALLGLEYLKGVRLIDQEPIGRTPRSNPVTYIKAFDEIRKIYASLPSAKVLGLGPGSFSFNVPGGRCEKCQGEGVQKLEMYFFEDTYVTCEECEGTRYRSLVREIKWKGKSIDQLLRLTVDEALQLFSSHETLTRRLRLLAEVGLGYLRLGQPATTLSGGEAQRLKIASELGVRQTADQLYILDEPTTGLHLDDINKLLLVLNRLVDSGNTVVVVEHHLDVIKTADWVIDLGPEGGQAGGDIVAEGTPEQIASHPSSYTGKFLREILTLRGGVHA